MTILVAYVARPEGHAALDKGMEIAGRRNERLVVVNASPGGTKEDSTMADVQEVERVENRIVQAKFVAHANSVMGAQSLKKGD